MSRIILVHGAWHGGWSWELIKPLLEGQGHEVLAPDLPGMGADAASGHVATLDEWAMFIAGMAGAGGEPATLVGHSRGGIVISRAAELAPQAVSKLVYVAGVMPLPSETMGALFKNDPNGSMAQFRHTLTLSEDGRTSRCTDRDAARATFYMRTPPDLADQAFARLSPEPTGLNAALLVLTPERYGRIPRHYIVCEQDETIHPGLQRAMIAAQPCPVSTLDTDHSPFYSTPDELARMIDAVAGPKK